MWPLPQEERERLALIHERRIPSASSTKDGFRLATCVVCERPMVAMWHLWANFSYVREYPGRDPVFQYVNFCKEIHMCHRCATDIYGAPYPDDRPGELPPEDRAVLAQSYPMSFGREPVVSPLAGLKCRGGHQATKYMASTAGEAEGLCDNWGWPGGCDAC